MVAMTKPLVTDHDEPRASRLLDYLRLFRAPNVFTAMADVTMGYLFVHGEFKSPAAWGGLVAASSLMYTSGMVLNDVYDIEVDRVERPGRPLPSGRISLAWARWIGYVLLLGGMALAWLVGFTAGENDAPWRPGAVASILAVAIVAYDAALKKTLVAPLAMGLCRFLNVLLGMSILPAGEPVLYSTAQLVVAAGIGVYVAGVTIFARGEAEESRRLPLLAGLAVMVGGIVLLATGPHLVKPDEGHPLWLLILVLVTVTILRRCLTAIASPTPKQVQTAVKVAILSLIPLNAAICAARAEPVYAMGVALLLLPAFLLGRWVYST
jgi:4-hydroxybenzoate polyprenyltransferase